MWEWVRRGGKKSFLPNFVSISFNVSVRYLCFASLSIKQKVRLRRRVRPHAGLRKVSVKIFCDNSSRVPKGFTNCSTCRRRIRRAIAAKRFWRLV